jgi:signal transduction histidine kinase
MNTASSFPERGHSRCWYTTFTCALWLVLGASQLWAQAPAAKPKPAYGIELTAEESEWLAKNPVVRIGGDPAWPPFSFYNERKRRYDGSDFEILRLALERLGLQAREVKARDWDDVVRQINLSEVDIVTSTTPTPARLEQLLFTRPYFTLPVAILARRDAPFVINTHHLNRSVRFAGPRGYITTDRFMSEHPEVPYILTVTSAEALEKVSKGEADIAIDNLGVASHYIRRHRLTNLKIAGFADERFELSMGVRNELPLLWSSLDKAVGSISPIERGTIMSRWVTDDYTPGLRWRGVLTTVLGVLAAAALIVGLLVWHNRRLKREIAQRLAYQAQLQDVNEQLQRLSEEKTTFMKMAAHDLKNPLGAILGTTELLLMHQLSRSLDQRTASLVGDVQENAYRMLRLIRNLLDADAIERGQTNLQPREIVLQKVVDEALTRFRHGANRKQIELIQEVNGEAGDDLKVFADEDALSQILDNLISNAVKFTPRGGKVRVRISGPLHHNGSTSARLEVCDDGPGIADEDRARLFEPNARLRSRPTAGESSHGLGLSIVRRLCASMGGSVTCEDNVERGACFTVELPAIEGSVAARK